MIYDMKFLNFIYTNMVGLLLNISLLSPIIFSSAYCVSHTNFVS